MWLNDQLVVNDWMADDVELDRAVSLSETPVRAEIRFQDQGRQATHEMSRLSPRRRPMRIFVPAAR